MKFHLKKSALLILTIAFGSLTSVEVSGNKSPILEKTYIDSNQSIAKPLPKMKISFGGIPALAYSNNEHPFANAGSYLSQKKGDSYCNYLRDRQVFTYLLNGRKVIDWTQDNKAYDGTSLRYLSHVWFNKSKGQCVANTWW
jgi:hypothetical protein